MNATIHELLTSTTVYDRVCKQLQKHVCGKVSWSKDEICTVGGSTVSKVYFFEEVRKRLLGILPTTRYRILMFAETADSMSAGLQGIYFWFTPTLNKAVSREAMLMVKSAEWRSR